MIASAFDQKVSNIEFYAQGSQTDLLKNTIPINTHGQFQGNYRLKRYRNQRLGKEGFFWCRGYEISALHHQIIGKNYAIEMKLFP